jgi:hypothetical protein
VNLEARLLRAIEAVRVLNFAKSDEKPVEVLRGLYIGSIGAALNKDALMELGIKSVLCVAGGINPPYTS